MGRGVYPPGPFRRVVALGDSITYGMCARASENSWVQVVARLLRQFQEGELQLVNAGLPAAVISPRCPGYCESAKPSLLERYEKYGVAWHPDLVLIAEGLNDMRSGMHLREYVADLETIVSDIQQRSGALVVLLGIYHQIYGRGANDPDLVPTWSQWNDTLAVAYNTAVRQTAHKLRALFVDVPAVMAGADWLVNPDDCCHPNDLGHLLIGHAVFGQLAAHCRGIAERTLREVRECGVSTANTGGADVDAETMAWWREAEQRFQLDT